MLWLTVNKREIPEHLAIGYAWQYTLPQNFINLVHDREGFRYGDEDCTVLAHVLMTQYLFTPIFELLLTDPIRTDLVFPYFLRDIREVLRGVDPDFTVRILNI